MTEKRILTKEQACVIISIVLIAVLIMFCSGCGLTARSLGAINKSLPATPLTPLKDYSPVQTLVISPDQKYLIQGQHITAKEGESFSGDVIQIWNIEKKKHTLISKHQTGAYLAATFDPNSKYAISCNNMGITRVNLQDNTTQVFTLEEPKYLSADGTYVACSAGKGWQVRSTTTNDIVINLPNTIDRFLAFSHDNSSVAATLKRNDQDSGHAIGIFSLPPDAEPTLEHSVTLSHAFATAEKTRFSPNGRFLALPSRQGYVGIWDIKTGKLHKELGVHDGSIRTLEFSPDNKLLATGTQEANGKHGKIYVWDVLTGKLLHEINETQAKGVTALCFADDNETIFFGNSSGEFKQQNITDKSWLPFR